MGRPVELSWPEYDFLWEHFDLGSFHPILDIPSHGRTFAERDDLRRAAWRSLSARGLGEPGDFDPRLEKWLRRLAGPEWELDGRLHPRLDQPRVSALIAGRGAQATVAVLDRRALGLCSVTRARASATAVSLLPPCPPGTGQSVTVPADDLDAAAKRAGSDPSVFAAALASRGVGRADAGKLAEVVGNTMRVAHFGAARTPRFQRRVRASYVVSVYDTDRHRYLFTRRPSAARHWVTLAPGTESAITRQIEELFGTLPRS
ncbi:ESX secretion-associated protein EspG [Actinokineospora iranica]|uniref:EspG family protein n=1 Tax=Actinokineospora iranica TaxID=1271860 RepID=A0A1G6M4B8_9PSEU|nr:ESX secretion-associated protein EspG [Actinokineospora iranica]SDC50343.1 EspG family protein [Actinokineospora iranica]